MPTQIVLWWVLFAGTHIGGSSQPIRPRLVRALGLQGFKALYTLVSFATLIPLVLFYWRARSASPPLWAAGWTSGWLADLLVLSAFIFIAEGYATSNALSTLAELTGKRRSDARGIQRITRHPVNTGFALFGLAHALANPAPAGLLFFGGFPLFCVASAVHQDKRTASVDEAERFQRDTSLIPFGAILSGRQRLVLGELHRGAIVVAALVFIVLRVAHPRLF